MILLFKVYTVKCNTAQTIGKTEIDFFLLKIMIRKYKFRLNK